MAIADVSPDAGDTSAIGAWATSTLPEGLLHTTHKRGQAFPFRESTGRSTSASFPVLVENTSNSKVIVGLGTGDASDWAIACLNGRGLRHVEGDPRPGRITGMMIFVPSGVRMAWLSEPTPAGRDVGAASRLWP